MATFLTFTHENAQGVRSPLGSVSAGLVRSFGSRSTVYPSAWRYTLAGKEYVYYTDSARNPVYDSDMPNIIHLPETSASTYEYVYILDTLRIQYKYYIDSTGKFRVELRYLQINLGDNQFRAVPNNTMYVVTLDSGQALEGITIFDGPAVRDNKTVDMCYISAVVRTGDTLNYWPAFMSGWGVDIFDLPESERYKPTRSRYIGGGGNGTYKGTGPEQLNAGARSGWFSVMNGNGTGLTYYVVAPVDFHNFIAEIYGTTLFVSSEKYQRATVAAYMLPWHLLPGAATTGIYCADKLIPKVSSTALIGDRVVSYAPPVVPLAGSGWGDFNDWVNTTYTLYLPFYGRVNLDPGAVAGGAVRVIFAIDTYTGGITYWLYTNNRNDPQQILYGSYSGNCAVNMPISGVYQSPLFSQLSAVAGLAAGAVVQSPGAILGAFGAGVQSMAPQVDRGGLVNPNNNPSLPLQIRLDVCTKNVIRVDNETTYTGKPSHNSGTVGKYTGYTEFYDVELDGFTASDQEKAEIMRLLKGGVIVG